MFFIRFFRFLTGYIVFTCKNGFPERFLNLCAINGINVWDAKAFNGKLEAKTNISGIKNINECAKKSGMSLRIIKECGLPFIIKPYLKRKGIILGISLSVILLIFLSSTVWTFEVNGNIKYTTEQILELAEFYGVYTGTFRKNIDQKAIRENIKATADGISWFSINVDGSAIFIDVLEINDERKQNNTSPCNIVSGVDGEILKLDVYAGDAAISVGSAVTQGDLLISGVKENADGSAKFVHAKGYAVIRTRKELNSTVPHTIDVMRTSSVEKRHSVYIFGATIPLGKEKQQDKFNSVASMLVYNDVILPVGIITDSYLTNQKEKISLSESQAVLLCSYLTFIKETEIMTNAQTESKKISITKNDDATNITISYINHETSGIEYYFVVEDTNPIGKAAQ